MADNSTKSDTVSGSSPWDAVPTLPPVLQYLRQQGLGSAVPTPDLAAIARAMNSLAVGAPTGQPDALRAPPPRGPGASQWLLQDLGIYGGTGASRNTGDPVLSPEPPIRTPAETPPTALGLDRAVDPWQRAAFAGNQAPAPVPAGPQSFAATVPPQSVSSFNQAVQQLGLNPQEQNLYQHHLSNLWGGGRVVQPGGDVSTVLQAVVQGPDGRFYNIPTVWNGASLPVDQARQQAAQAGWGNWPAYATPEAADARYMDMHGMMERDTAAWLAQNPNADPMNAMILRQQQTQHPILQMLEQLRQQQGQ